MYRLPRLACLLCWPMLCICTCKAVCIYGFHLHSSNVPSRPGHVTLHNELLLFLTGTPIGNWNELDKMLERQTPSLRVYL